MGPHPLSRRVVSSRAHNWFEDQVHKTNSLCWYDCLLQEATSLQRWRPDAGRHPRLTSHKTTKRQMVLPMDCLEKELVSNLWSLFLGQQFWCDHYLQTDGLQARTQETWRSQQIQHAFHACGQVLPRRADSQMHVGCQQLPTGWICISLGLPQTPPQYRHDQVRRSNRSNYAIFVHQALKRTRVR